MTDRREFLQYSGAAAITATVPSSLLAEQVQQMARRAIPGTDESLAVVGYGNSSAFGEGDMEVSRELMALFLDHGGSYVDTSGNGRNTIGTIMRERDAHDELFLGTYVAGKDGSQ